MSIICQTCIDFENEICDCSPNDIYQDQDTYQYNYIESDEIKRITKIGQLVSNNIHNKFDTMNTIYEEYNVKHIKRTIKNTIEDMVEKYEFKDIRYYLINLILNSKDIFLDIGLRYNIHNSIYKKEELYKKINELFPLASKELIDKCKYEVNSNYIKILQNIVDKSIAIHEKNWVEFNCYNCNYINDSSSIICKQCNIGINYNEYNDKYNKMLTFGVSYNDYMEQYNDIMKLKDLIKNRQIFLKSNESLLFIPFPTITIEMGELYSNIENLQFDKYYSLYKSNHLDLYEKWKVYNSFYKYKEQIKNDLIDINSIEESKENNRYSTYDKYPEEYEIWFSKRNYYYHFYVLDKILFKDTCEKGLIISILSYSHPTLELYCNNDMKSYDNDFYKWYLTY
jgi:hypothetical protein